MELATILSSRRSIRSFTGEPISDHALAKILSAANAAPVGMGKYETVHLTVVKSKALLNEIEKNTAEVFDAHGRSFLYNAPELVIVSTTGSDNVSCSNAAILVQNMALQAVECGVGACHIWGCILALGKNPALIEKLGIPEGFVPSCAIALGLSDEVYTEREVPQDRVAVNYV